MAARRLAGSVVGPVITKGDILNGTIFSGNNTGQFGGDARMLPQMYEARTTAADGSVSAMGLLATITVDTTPGLNSGTFALAVERDSENGDTDFSGVAAHCGLLTVRSRSSRLGCSKRSMILGKNLTGYTFGEQPIA